MGEQGAMFDEFVQGGLLDDADCTIKSARFNQWDYRGKIVQPVLALRVELEDADGLVHEEQLSAGELKTFVPSSDGKKAVAVGAQTKLNVNTNAVAFLVSLINADTRGELAAKIRSTDDISVLDGTKIHIVRKPQPKRSGIIQQPAAEGGTARQAMQLTATSVLGYAWEAGTTAAKPAAANKTAAPAAAAAAAPAAAAGGTDVDEEAQNVLLSILAENGMTIKVGQIAGKVFSNADMKAKPTPVRNAVVGLVVKPEFLGAEGRPWTYDKAAGTVTLG